MLNKNFVKAWLSFGKRDRIAILVLISVLGFVYALPLIFVKDPGPVVIKEGSVLDEAVDSLQSWKEDPKKENQHRFQTQSNRTSMQDAIVFSFDPNSLDEAGWKKLGLDPRTARTILNYRNKGGKFKKPSDLEKIWGLPKGFYEKVKDSIRIEYHKSESEPFNFSENSSNENKTYKPAIVDINQADTAALIALPGIGNKLARRIINYREKLGGFYSIEQVGETYGLQDSVFQKIKQYLKLEGSPKKMNINTITADELKLHPYFKWNLAKAIVSYRSQHGNFRTLEELKNISLIDEEAYNRIINYVEL